MGNGMIGKGQKESIILMLLFTFAWQHLLLSYSNTIIPALSDKVLNVIISTACVLKPNSNNRILSSQYVI
jgi:hypothetical protein